VRSGERNFGLQDRRDFARRKEKVNERRGKRSDSGEFG